MASTILIRAKLTEHEWIRIRKQALDKGIPTSQLVGTALRTSLLKGGKA